MPGERKKIQICILVLYLSRGPVSSERQGRKRSGRGERDEKGGGTRPSELYIPKTAFNKLDRRRQGEKDRET